MQTMFDHAVPMKKKKKKKKGRKKGTRERDVPRRARLGETESPDGVRKLLDE